MSKQFVPMCAGNYNFGQISRYTVKRFIDGENTYKLIGNAKSQRQKDEIVLVSLLDVENYKVRDIRICCRHYLKCEKFDCEAHLRDLIEGELNSRVAKLLRSSNAT